MIRIVPAKPEDSGKLTEIAFAAKQHWGYPKRWMESWRDILTATPESIARQETFSAVVDGKPVGFYALERMDGRMELMHLWVTPEWMGQGVGRLLFFHAVDRAKALGFRELQIESDPNAADFYLHLGAKPVGVNTYKIDQQRRELPVLIYENAV